MSACCQVASEAAWTEFIRRFQSLIARVVIRTARRWIPPSPALVDDLVQETYLKLCEDHCRLLREFQPRQPDAFYGFLKVVAANVVRDHFRATLAAKRGSGQANECLDSDTTRPIVSGEPQSAPRHVAERPILLREIDEHLAKSVSGQDAARSRLVFWLYYRSGLSASAIASLPDVGLTTKGVESLLHRLTRSVRMALTQQPETNPEKADSYPDRKGYRQAESL